MNHRREGIKSDDLERNEKLKEEIKRERSHLSNDAIMYPRATMQSQRIHQQLDPPKRPVPGLLLRLPWRCRQN
jgi:hypothetical protein